MDYNQSLLNARYNQDDKNEHVYTIFEHELARDLHTYKPHERQCINALEKFILYVKEIDAEFEMSGDVWDFSNEVVEATENAIITCNEWDKQKHTNVKHFNGGNYYG